MPALRRPPPAPTARAAHLPCGLGGINAVSPPSSMPPEDYVYAFNVIPGVGGLRQRGGYQEWATGLTGGVDASVRTMLPFVGGRKSGATNRLFAVTAAGIWDVSSSGAATVPVVAFPTSAADAGYGESCVMTTPTGGRFLAYCDEEHGLHVYTEASASWAQVAGGTTAAWTRDTAYAAGNTCINLGNEYVCSVPGVSAASGGPTGTGAGIVDGTATWDYVGAAATGVIGPSLADAQRGLTADPAGFVQPHVFKNRLWFVEKDSTRAWYLDAGSVYGTATSFDFGPKMQRGGPLVGLYSWSYDGGSGLDTLLVAISAAGDVVIYQGTDPSSASTFGLKGSWYVGGVPAGRRIAQDDGKDVLVLSTLGLLRLSTLVASGAEVDADRYESAKVGPLLSALVASRGQAQGWGLYVHPTDACLLVAYPTLAGEETQQLARASAGARGWWGYRGLPVASAAVYGGELYFGTPDGRVCVARGDVDEVSLADSSSFRGIQSSFLTAPFTGGNARQKQVTLARPLLRSQTPRPVTQLRALYDWDDTEPTAPSGNGGGGAGTWDAATWDTSVWGGDSQVSRDVTGVTGMGSAVSLAFRFNAISRTSVLGFEVAWTEGGWL